MGLVQLQYPGQIFIFQSSSDVLKCFSPHIFQRIGGVSLGGSDISAMDGCRLRDNELLCSAIINWILVV